jgi:uncharacterized delta-60 repeat protein
MGTRRSLMTSSARQYRLAAASALVLLAACNALTGAGDLTAAPCENCDEVEGGGGGNVDGAPDGVTHSDAKPDTEAEAPVEGPGGALDPTFGVGGILEVDDLLPDPRAVAVRADGRILVTGSVSGDLAAVAITSSGAIDTAFGTAGRIIKASGNSSAGNAIVFDSQARALIGGVATAVTAGMSMSYPYVVRVGPSQVDTTFGTTGSWRAATPGDALVGLVAIAGDSIVFAAPDNEDHTFGRLTPAGDPDGTFGLNGKASVPAGAPPAGLVARADGFVSGGTGDAVAGRAFAAAKVTLAGQAAAGFGVAGKATSKVGPNNTEIGRAIAAQPNGLLVVAGDYDPNVGLVRRVSAVTRFTAAGQVDTAFGTAGNVRIDLTDVGLARDTDTSTRAVVVDAKGRTLVVGTLSDRLLLGANRTRTWAVRLREDGSFDPLFGKQGVFLVGTAPAELQARGAALQPDGKLVVVGIDTNGGKLFVARIITSTTQ